eukprot:761205-Hanusia_phi.AAC.2
MASECRQYGVGMWLSERFVDGSLRPVCVRVSDGTSAFFADVKPGDVIETVNGSKYAGHGCVFKAQSQLHGRHVIQTRVHSNS